MFRVKHREYDIIHFVYSTRVDDKGMTSFLIFDNVVKRWFWVPSEDYAPY